jgi:endoglucanase
MAVQPDNGYLQRPGDQSELIVEQADAAIKKGLYVLIDWHDHNSHLHQQEAKKFFAAMAQRYKGVPNVIYEVWNEPEVIGWDTIKNYAIQVIKEIRKHDPDNLIVVGSPHWDQDVDIAAANPIVGFKNIAYSFHFYASEANHQQGLRAKADKAIKLGLPLFVTEWGVGEANGGGKFDLEKNAAWMKWMADNKLSWCNWSLTDKKETTAILLPGAPAQGNWSRDNLSPAGIYIRNLLRKLNN